MIIHNENFILNHIAQSGQCFRMNEINSDTYGLVAFGKYIELKQLDKKRVEIKCSEEEFAHIWRDYFDIDYGYDAITQSLITGEDTFLRDAANFGYGLRILKQDVFEVLISFIISQRKSIPAIKTCIENLSRRFGEPILTKSGISTGNYSFPKPSTLAYAKLEELREMGLGYRDHYVKNTALAVINGKLNLDELKQAGYKDAMEKLMELPGVGIKVANCVALYGLHFIDAFPIDVWIERILKNIYHNHFDVYQYNGFAGIVQQYIFYYIRSEECKTIPEYMVL